MTSQSPIDDHLTDSYSRGWSAVNRMVREGFSWSGREAHTAFLNLGDGSFADISGPSGLDLKEDGRAFALSDWDHDGDLDFWLVNRTAPQVRFFENNGVAGQGFIALRLQGTTANRDAIGARVTLLNGQDSHVRVLQAGSGYLSQSSKWLHFGLGSAEVIPEMVVTWPHGQVQRFADVAANQFYTLVQGEASLEVNSHSVRRIRELGGAGSPPKIEPSEQARIGLVSVIPLPPLQTADANNKAWEPGQGGKPLLVNFWASWCGPCVVELTEWNRNQKQLEPKLDLLALSVDHLTDKARPGADQATMKKLRPWFSWGTAPTQWVETFDLLQRAVTDRQRDMPVPTSFLLDGRGRLACVYKGPVALDQLLDDLQALEKGEGKLQSNYFPGKLYGPPKSPPLFNIVEQFIQAGQLDHAGFYLKAMRPQVGSSESGHQVLARLAGLQNRLSSFLLEAGRDSDAAEVLQQSAALEGGNPITLFLLGQVHFKAKDFARAESFFKRAVAADPDYGEAWNRLGTIQLSSGRQQEAMASFKQAIAVNPDLAEAWLTLGIFYISSGNLAEAGPYFQKAVTLDPENSLAWTGWGSCLQASQDLDGARQAFQKALDLDGGNKRARQMLDRLEAL